MTAIASRLLSELADALEPNAAERCGLIMSDGSIVEIENIHNDPARGFHIEPVAFFNGITAGAVATWHTHPAKDPNLSEEDMHGFAQWPALTHHIVGIRDGEPAVHSFAFDGNILVTV